MPTAIPAMSASPPITPPTIGPVLLDARGVVDVVVGPGVELEVIEDGNDNEVVELIVLNIRPDCPGYVVDIRTILPV